MKMPTSQRGLRADLSEKSMDQGRNLVSALFMAVRTAQIHDSGNRAFVQAVDMVHRAAETLFASTGGFSLRFVEDVAFLNGRRIRFDTSGFAAIRTLRRILEQHELGGLTLRAPPTRHAMHRLVSAFGEPAGGASTDLRADLGTFDIDLHGVQRFADRGEARVDPRVFAVQCYAKLLLAVREQLVRLRAAREQDWRNEGGKPPRLRAVRVIQDLIELAGERPDFLLRMALNRTGADPLELAGANASVLAIAAGYAIGVPRGDLVDIGVAGLFHHLDEGAGLELPTSWTGAPTAIAQILSDGGIGPSSYLRALTVAERPTLGAAGARTSDPHPYAQFLGVIIAFGELTSDGTSQSPLDALATLWNDTSRFDRRWVDLLVNVLRAFPVGVEVILDDHQRARVLTHLGGSRWDRPMVQLEGPNGPERIDLMVKRDGRFERRILGTRYALEGTPGTAPKAGGDLQSGAGLGAATPQSFEEDDDPFAGALVDGALVDDLGD